MQRQDSQAHCVLCVPTAWLECRNICQLICPDACTEQKSACRAVFAPAQAWQLQSHRISAQHPLNPDPPITMLELESPTQAKSKSYPVQTLNHVYKQHSLSFLLLQHGTNTVQAAAPCSPFHGGTDADVIPIHNNACTKPSAYVSRSFCPLRHSQLSCRTYRSQPLLPPQCSI